MPPPDIRFTHRCTKISTTRAMPEKRMKTQAAISKLPEEVLLRRYLGSMRPERGASRLVAGKAAGVFVVVISDHPPGRA
ncbi:hypothetical protein GCM10027060_07270 [Nesterenkonia halophila]|uniref:Uncharacterized protein n=1 Tax=Nesterenkonia halobia TaxID=37922 RepID=A0ABP6RD19_9MICC